MRSVCDEAGEFGQTQDYAPLSQSGTEGDTWMLIDFVDVVVHVFSQDARGYYDLDGLWGDAQRLEWRDETTAQAAAQPTQHDAHHPAHAGS